MTSTVRPACHEEILVICRPRGETWFAGLSLYSLGLGLRKQGDATAAAAQLREGLDLVSRVNDTPGAGWCLDVLAWSADDEGRPERAATLLSAVTGLAHAMGIVMVAEGVETVKQLRFLIDHECDAIQGTLVSPPLPHEWVEPFVVGHSPARYLRPFARAVSPSSKAPGASSAVLAEMSR